jgi:hypothetical protein
MGAVPFQDTEVGLVREPGDVADLDQESGGAGGPDAVEVQQPGAGGGDELGELIVGGLLARVEPAPGQRSGSATVPAARR